MSGVTVVIPCYNAARFLAETLSSVSAQTMPIEETVVVDDGSSDSAFSIAHSAGATVLSTSGQRGPGFARNMGAQHAHTPYIAFLDADDIWLPQHCASLLPLLIVNPAVALAFGRVQYFGDSHEISRPWLTEGRPTSAFPDLLRANFIPQSATIVNRSKFLEVGGYVEDLRYAEDFDLWFRLAERFPFVASHRVTCRYRVHAGQATRSLDRLIHGAWVARLAARARLEVLGAYSPLHEQMLREGFESDMQTAWYKADGPALAELFRVAPRIVGGAHIVEAFRPRLRWIHLRRALLQVRDFRRNRWERFQRAAEPEGHR
jgi:glycosyltransferase involved in cell wall biosynthesis